MAIVTLLICDTIETAINSSEYYFTVSRNGTPIGQIIRPYRYIGDRNADDWRMWQAIRKDGSKICNEGYLTAKSALRAIYRDIYGLGKYPPVTQQSYDI